ncbi:MAG: GNAT family N-acetyltransferase [Chloroflexi bacterium]|nr:GNAT family N-acetyltransferase [Chloroflexota bacterium]
MSLKIFNEVDKEEWNSIVDKSIPYTSCHRWEWLRIAAKHSNTNLYPLVHVDKGGNPLAAFPLFFSRKGPLKMVFSPPPGSAMRLGPIFIDSKLKTHKKETIYKEFQTEVEEFINYLGANYVLIATSPGLIDIRPFKWADYTATPTYNYIVDLTKGEDNLWASFKRELRNNIKRTQKSGVVVIEEISDKNVDHLYNSLDRRYQGQSLRLGISGDYLRDLFEQSYELSLKLFVAYYEGNVVGSIAHVGEKQRLVVWVGAVKNNISGLAVNDLIQWEAIKWAIQNGYHEYEIVGANIPRLCLFKSKYSPDLNICFILKKAGLLGRISENGYQFWKKHRR